MEEDKAMKEDNFKISKRIIIHHFLKAEREYAINNLTDPKVECHLCHKLGHYRSECYSRLPQEGEKSNFVEKKEEKLC